MRSLKVILTAVCVITIPSLLSNCDGGGSSSSSDSVEPGESDVVDRVFSALLANDQSVYPLDPAITEYYISYTANAQQLTGSDYAFTMFIDTPEVRSFSLHGGLNDFRVFIPFGVSDTVNILSNGILEQSEGIDNLPNFADDQDYTIEHFLDFANDSWSIHIDGVELYRSSINASSAESLRFSMAPWNGAADSDAPETTVEVSNFTVLTNLPN